MLNGMKQILLAIIFVAGLLPMQAVADQSITADEVRRLEAKLLAVISRKTVNAPQAWLEKALAAYRVHNYKFAARIFIPLAEQGHMEAQRLLGIMYMHGDGVEQDPVMARYWVGMAEAQARRNIKK